MIGACAAYMFEAGVRSDLSMNGLPGKELKSWSNTTTNFDKSIIFSSEKMGYDMKSYPFYLYENYTQN